MKFSQISDQYRAKVMLSGAIGNKRVANAYLFLGSYGSGIREAALSFASALNCERYKGDSCGECPHCKKTDKGTHPDVYILREDGGSVKIDQIREMISYTRFGPSFGKWKVCIIDDAQSMTNEAANSFLKTLEEPLPNIVFLLLAESEVGLPKTIMSRCQKIIFGELPANAGVESGIADEVEILYGELKKAPKSDIVKLLDVSSKIIGEGVDVELTLESLASRFWDREGRAYEAVRAVLNALSAVKKRANSRLAVDCMCLKLGEILSDK